MPLEPQTLCTFMVIFNHQGQSVMIYATQFDTLTRTVLGDCHMHYRLERHREAIERACWPQNVHSGRYLVTGFAPVHTALHLLQIKFCEVA